MKQFKGTPGSWSNVHRHFGVTNVFSENGRIVANCGGYQNNALEDNGQGESAHNARAIAALPDLIYALQEVTRAYRTLSTPDDKNAKFILGVAEKALNKALGDD